MLKSAEKTEIVSADPERNFHAFFETDEGALALLPLALNSVGYAVRQILVSRLSGYGFHELIWVTRGSGVFNVLGENFTLSEGQGIFMRADVPHKYDGGDYSTKWFTFSMADSALDFMKVPRFFRFDVMPRLEADTNALYVFSVSEKSNYLTRSVLAYSYVTEFFSSTLGLADTVSARVRLFLESRFGEPITLDEIAAELGIDKFALCHTFLAERNKSIMTELKEIRIENAKKYLRYSGEKIADVGRVCGFDSPSYFIKEFKRAVGVTPKNYRNNEKI